MCFMSNKCMITRAVIILQLVLKGSTLEMLLILGETLVLKAQVRSRMEHEQHRVEKVSLMEQGHNQYAKYLLSPGETVNLIVREKHLFLSSQFCIILRLLEQLLKVDMIKAMFVLFIICKTSWGDQFQFFNFHVRESNDLLLGYAIIA